MALDLFAPMSGKMLSDALRELREEAEPARIAAYDYRQNFFEGCEKTKPYLTRHPAESPGPWAARQARFSDCGVTSRAAGALIASLAGHEIERELEGASEAEEATLAKVYADSRIASRQRMIAQNQIVCGDGFALIAWSDRLGMLLIHSVDPGNMTVVPHPDDPMREGMVVEHRLDPRDDDGKAMIHWFWTPEQKNLIDDDGVELDQGDGSRGWVANPYSVIPYVHYSGLPLSESYWGRSPVAATVEIHRAANNLRSQHHHLIVMQAHSLLTVSDHNFTSDSLKTGENNVLVLSAEGRAAFLAPGADIASIEGAYQRNIDEAFQLVGIPVAILKGGEVPSGYALTVAYQSKTEIVTDLATEFRAAEEEVLRKVCIIGNVHGLRLPQDPVPDIDMNVEVFPADTMAKREQDRLDWEAGLLTTEDYVTRWVVPQGTPQEGIDEYVAKLTAERAVKAAQSNPFAGALNLPPEQRPGLL